MNTIQIIHFATRLQNRANLYLKLQKTNVLKRVIGDTNFLMGFTFLIIKMGE